MRVVVRREKGKERVKIKYYSNRYYQIIGN